MGAEPLASRLGLTLTGDDLLPVRVPLTRLQLAVLFAQWGYTEGAEVGVYRGEYTEHLCRTNPKLHLVGIDPWASYPAYQDQRAGAMATLPQTYDHARQRLAPYTCTLLRMTSALGVLQIQPASLDFVFIDGNHAYAYVLEDLELWSTRVRPSGIVSGHDYHRFRRRPYHHIKVIDAVNRFVADHAIRPWFLLDDGTFLWEQT